MRHQLKRIRIRSSVTSTAVFMAAAGLALGASSYGLTHRVNNQNVIINGDDTPATVSWQTEPVFPGLTFNATTFLTNAHDGTNRIFVGERAGKIWALSPVNDPKTDTPTETLFLDISTRVQSSFGNELGLLCMAVHPSFNTNGQVFVSYSTGSNFYPLGQTGPDPVRTRISRFYLTADQTALDPSHEDVLLEIEKHFFNHNGGQLAFGPDGYLYIGVGDGGSAGDPERNGQNLRTLKGKILRIDPDHGSPYAIPSDNPFVTTPNAMGEIWAYGLRNPWRFSFDQDGTLWLGDVGQDAYEEIDIIQKGGNYGWSEVEGNHPYNGQATSSMIPPVIEYDHATQGGGCVIGGYVYRGSRLPQLQGIYIYGDYMNGNIWGARFSNGTVTSTEVLVSSTQLTPSSFGVDEANELYLCSYKEAGAGIYRLAANTTTSTFPETLSATGIFADVTSQQMAPEAIPYGVNEPLWSDYALKQRYMILPGTQKATRTDTDGWTFPDNTILVKHFFLEGVRGTPTTQHPVETRLLIKHSGAWKGYSYQWNDTGTDGTLLQTSKKVDYPVVVNGQNTTQTWYYPARGECFTCHNDATNNVLGIQTRQLNSDFDYSPFGGTVDNQLRALNHIHLFTSALGSTKPASLPRFYAHDDQTASLDDRARSYLHVNCSHCHRPGSGVPVPIDLRFDTPLAQTGVYNKTPGAGDMGIGAKARLIAPGDPDSSVLYKRMLATDGYRMPRVGSSVVDDAGASLIHDWIAQLP
jgi:uncharacterized repeat protein (TIGR03806 family)